MGVRFIGLFVKLIMGVRFNPFNLRFNYYSDENTLVFNINSINKIEAKR